MTVKFYLDKPTSKEETAIYLFLRFGKKTLKFNTRKKIHPKNWNADNPTNHFRKFTGSPELNNWLSELRGDVDKLYYSEKEWTVEGLKEATTNIIAKNLPKDTKQTFTAALSQFIDSRESNKELSRNTIKKYKTLESHLTAFSSSSGLVLRFEIVNKRFFEEFSAYLRNNLKHTTNTVNKYLKTLKTFVHWAVDHEYTKSDIVSTKYTIKDDATEVIYLTEEELMRIYYLELPNGSPLDNARDVFCFACFTGQRFSDVANLKREDIVGSNWILHQIKLKDTLKNEVPLSDRALKIIEKHRNDKKVLPVISNQKTNEYLKLIGEKAGVNDIVKIVRYRGNESIITRNEKFKCLGTHTARRTFVTLSLENGMPPEIVMAITGHTDYKTMKRYTAITDARKSKELKLVWNGMHKPADKKKKAS